MGEQMQQDIAAVDACMRSRNAVWPSQYRAWERIRANEANQKLQADAYEISCEDLEKWQEKRIAQRRRPGTQGSLCDGMASICELLEEAEDRQAQLVEALRESLEAMDALASRYPKNVTGLIADAQSKARAALAAAGVSE